MIPKRDLNLLTVNTGSSSLKLAVYHFGETETCTFSANIDRIGQQKVPDHGTALRILLERIQREAIYSRLDGAGHRVVLGDRRCLEHQLITKRLSAVFQELVQSAPDHVPQVIESISTLESSYPGMPQAACSDSAFHSRMPRVSQMYALPLRLFEQGVLRYGFHGLSCEYIMQELDSLDPAAANGRVIIAHLGNGSSVTAVDHGKSIDTSMGFTPMSGLVMGTRCGDVDPGVLLHLMDRDEMTSRGLNDLLNKKSGLLGLSEHSADMRDLIEREAADARCADAITVFCYHVRKFIGAYTAALGGLDTVVFTGGIGEHSAVIRERICTGLNCLGITLDSDANRIDAGIISAKSSLVTVRVIRTDEDLMIARHTSQVITNSKT
ncbi:MAG TPA: acetate/propionate family kinase [Terriglobia bacterium]|jgi:acetate kinase